MLCGESSTRCLHACMCACMHVRMCACVQVPAPHQTHASAASGRVTDNNTGASCQGIELATAQAAAEQGSSHYSSHSSVLAAFVPGWMWGRDVCREEWCHVHFCGIIILATADVVQAMAANSSAALAELGGKSVAEDAEDLMLTR